jgi:hypothetical protein
MSDAPMTVFNQLTETNPVLPDQALFPSWTPENWQMDFGQYVGGLVGSRFNTVSININKPSIHLGLSQFAITEQQQQWSLTVLSLENNIRKLTTEMEELKEEIRQLCRTRTFVVPLTTLAPAPFQIMQQIPVTIEGDGEEFTATFSEASVSGSGDTEAEAIDNFKDALLSNYDLYENMPASKLGKSIAQQWCIIKNVIRRTE